MSSHCFLWYPELVGGGGGEVIIKVVAGFIINLPGTTAGEIEVAIQDHVDKVGAAPDFRIEAPEKGVYTLHVTATKPMVVHAYNMCRKVTVKNVNVNHSPWNNIRDAELRWVEDFRDEDKESPHKATSACHMAEVMVGPQLPGVSICLLL